MQRRRAIDRRGTLVALALAIGTLAPAPAALAGRGPTASEALSEIAHAFAAIERYGAATALTTGLLDLQKREYGYGTLEVAMTQYRLGVYAIEQGECRAAERWFRESLPVTNVALERKGSLAGTLARFAHDQLHRGSPRVAASLFERAIELRSNERLGVDQTIEAWRVSLAQLYEQLGDLERAMARYKESFRAAPDDAVALSLWRVTAGQGRLARADKFLASYLTRRGTNAGDAWSRRVIGYVVGEADADAFVRATADPDPEIQRERECEAYLYIGSRQLAMGQRDAAAESLRRSASIMLASGPNQAIATAMLRRAGGTAIAGVTDE